MARYCATCQRWQPEADFDEECCQLCVMKARRRHRCSLCGLRYEEATLWHIPALVNGTPRWLCNRCWVRPPRQRQPAAAPA